MGTCVKHVLPSTHYYVVSPTFIYNQEYFNFLFRGFKMPQKTNTNTQAVAKTSSSVKKQETTNKPEPKDNSSNSKTGGNQQLGNTNVNVDQASFNFYFHQK